MNKTAIKNFSVWARRKLINDITYKAALLGISERGILHPLSSSTSDVHFFDIGTGKPTEIVGVEIKQRNALIKRIQEKENTSDYKTAFQFVIEEVAYTWFNRLIAIRFMEVNDYLPSRIRVLSSEIPGKIEPDMVTKPFETDMDFSAYEIDKIMQLKDENKLNELFRMLFVKQCNKLNEVLPGLFEKMADYTELLLNISFTDSDGIVSHLINDIVENDFTEDVEVIGWMYQYYNIEPKDEAFALLKKNVKITKERIPAATQLFTPDWIVKYMVENSLGKLWVEGHPDGSLKTEWKYFFEETEQENSVKAELEKKKEEYKRLLPKDIKVIDPCMGSGHILVYVFDVLMQIYESQGYTQRDATQSIIENNIYGLDIDDRAYQLSYFAIMMKARKYDRKFLTRGISPKVYSIKESNDIKKSHLQYFGHSLHDMERKLATQQITYLLDTLKDAKEYGSIINIERCNWELIYRFVDDFQFECQLTLDNIDAENTRELIRELITISEVLANKYDVVVTNPPYMGGKGMSTRLANYVKVNYFESKADLYTVFIEKCGNMLKPLGFRAMITQHSWMFLATFESFRKNILLKTQLVNMIHLGARAFEEISGEVVQTVAFVTNNMITANYRASFSRLVNYKSQSEKELAFLDKKERYSLSAEDLDKIPGSPIVYWLSKQILDIFGHKSKLDKYGYTKGGMGTSDNERFLRLWFEVSYNDIAFNIKSHDESIASYKKWFPYNKGGSYRKWYGNMDYLLNWENDGQEVKELATKLYKTYSRTVKNIDSFFLEGATWSSLATKFSMRFSQQGFIFDSKGSMLFSKDKSTLLPIIGFLNSKISEKMLLMLSPTLDFSGGALSKLTYLPEIFNETVVNNVQNNINLSKADWDCFENSWDFKKHPLLNGTDMKTAYINWQYECNERFNQLKVNEEMLNQIFIDIYRLHEEITSEVEDKDVSIRKADLQRDIISFISYAVGCMFGRYSLDMEGLIFAGGEWNDHQYSTFIPNKDNIIPITDEEYFEDDIVGLFIAFVKKAYGEETLEENLEFIANALGNKGNTSREIIRNYFVKDFYKDHIKTYQKRPIYWLYDSGKNDSFKALIYMHRYNADTTGIVRVDYLHKMQKIYMNEIDRMQEMVDNSSNSREVAQAEKRKEKLVKQLKETKEYDEKIAHLALSRIAIDLDDGVKVNYEKIQTGQDGKKLGILAKI